MYLINKVVRSRRRQGSKMKAWHLWKKRGKEVELSGRNLRLWCSSKWRWPSDESCTGQEWALGPLLCSVTDWEQPLGSMSLGFLVQQLPGSWLPILPLTECRTARHILMGTTGNEVGEGGRCPSALVSRWPLQAAEVLSWLTSRRLASAPLEGHRRREINSQSLEITNHWFIGLPYCR